MNYFAVQIRAQSFGDNPIVSWECCKVISPEEFEMLREMLESTENAADQPVIAAPRR